MINCTSVRPIAKIGLIAPFEGLYRESGYAALTAMRQAIADCTPSGLDVMPLALDDSGDPVQARRAAQKLLVDPTVAAVIGPLLLDTIPAVTSVMSEEVDIPWLVPVFITMEGGFDAPRSASWLQTQVEYIATTTTVSRIILLGLPDEWPVEIDTDGPILRIDDLESAIATVEAGDTLLWLGRPEEGARWLSVLRRTQPALTFWLAHQAGIDIFAAHTTDLDATYWLVWADAEYNAGSQPTALATQPTEMIYQQTYRATCVALNGMGGGRVDGAATQAEKWQLAHWPLAPLK